ncbi:MAG: hypothetical protein ABR535_05885 [Pyrinomonadaceae bacterium]
MFDRLFGFLRSVGMFFQIRIQAQCIADPLSPLAIVFGTRQTGVRRLRGLDTDSIRLTRIHVGDRVARSKENIVNADCDRRDDQDR